VLTLLSHIFNRRGIHVEAGGLRRYFDSSVSDALSSDEFFIQFALNIRFLYCLHKWLFLSQPAVYIEIFSLYDVVFLAFKQRFLFLLQNVHFLLHVKRGQNNWTIVLTHSTVRLDSALFILFRSSEV